MTDSTLQSQLVRIEFLLVLGVSFLSGLVFGQGYSGEALFAVVSFVGLELLMILMRNLQIPTE